MKKTVTILIILIAGNLPVFSQSIDLNKPGDMLSKDKWMTIHGGFSASSIYYTGTEPYARDPFTWYLSGTVNLNLMGLLDLPFTFNFTNSGSNYTYPTLPNRLSLHPTYKFLTAHIGDVAMTFSPYTLSGHQFTGAGLDINPDKPFKCSVMYGRLVRPVEYGGGSNAIQAAYKRMGSGVNLRYEQKRFRLGASLLVAKDNENSLAWKPDSLFIYPKQNLAGSFSAGIEVIPSMQLTAEYGVSLLNNDIRKGNEQEQLFHAFKTALNYTFLNNTIGIGYERIDPDYKTLGAYYFNNDFENITLHYARPFFNNKATLALSGGMQRDDLDNKKESQTKRFVFSADAGYAASERLNFSGSYSTFQTHMNLRSQFDYINELTPYDNLDTLNYTQLSQNVNLSINYLFGKETQKQQLNLSLNLQEAADKQGDVIPEGAASHFYNAALGYGMQIVPQDMDFNVSLNASQSRMDGQSLFVIGPTAGITARFLDKKLSSGIVASYNTGYLTGTKQNDVSTIRLNLSYLLLKKHNLSLSAIYRNNAALNNAASMLRTNGLTVTATYSYRF
ncbi:hypothetical protein FACS1894182_11850 [Bacteroidia bacterium]|nr:hypothetical protein FACS1894182_11850 [Bacteroidia bacterium]